MVAGLVAIVGCSPQSLTMREPLFASLLADPLVGTALGRDLQARDQMAAALESFRDGRFSDTLRAMKQLERAVTPGSPELQPILAVRTLVYLAAGDIASARHQVDELLSLDRRSPAGLIAQAAFLYATDDDDGTLRVLAQVPSGVVEQPGLKLLSSRAKARAYTHSLEKARMAEAMGDRVGALAHVRNAIVLEPNQITLRRQQAVLSMQTGDFRGAIEAYEVVTKLEPKSPDGWIGLGEAHMRAGDNPLARAAFETAASLPGGLERARAHMTEIRQKERDVVATDPERLRAESTATIDRAGLAAQLGANLRALKSLTANKQPIIVTDIATSWARSQIQELVAAGIFEIYDNHTFRPEAIVTRVMLAQVAAAVVRSYREAGWLTERSPPATVVADLPPEHMSYSSVMVVLGHGLMSLTADGMFRSDEPVSGREASEVIRRLSELVH